MDDQVKWNESTKGSNVTIIDDYTVSVSGLSNNVVQTNVGYNKGKYYMEFTMTVRSSSFIGFCNENISTLNSISSPYYSPDNQTSVYMYNAQTFPAPSQSTGLTIVNGDIVMVKVDFDKKIWNIGVNGNWSAINIPLPTGKIFYPIIMNATSSLSCNVTANFGYSDFAYTIPSGYKALNGISDNCLIKMNGNYYSFKQENYNSDTQMYNAINDLSTDNFDDYSLGIDDLFIEVTIGSETFKPIDKFNNFQLIMDKNFNISLKAIKSYKEMVIANGFINTKVASNIDYFNHVYSIPENCSIKCAIYDGSNILYTTNNGVTWSNSSLSFIDKSYNELTEEEQISWNALRDEVYTNGFDIKDTSNINFNTIANLSKLKFIYVIEITSASDTCTTNELKWQFDALGSFLQLDKNELNISMDNNGIIIKALKDMDILKVNVNRGFYNRG